MPVPIALRTPLGLLALSLLFGAGCNRGTAKPPAPPPLPVTVVAAEKRDVPITVEVIGTTRALNDVTIRPRVSGFLKEKHFEEGSDVKAGQLLLVIDEAPFIASRDAAKANLDEAVAEHKAAQDSKQVAINQAQLLITQAQQYYAQIQERRAQVLLQRVSITREEYEEKKTALMRADADVQSKTADLDQAKVTFESNIALSKAKVEKARADLTQAELNLGYCRMSAPIDGRAGELQVKLGNYVDQYTGSASTTMGALMTIQQLDPMGIDFRPSSRYLTRVLELVKLGLFVRIYVQGDRLFPHEGKAVFADNTVDPTTSTFLLRASVPNPEKTLLPGDFLRVEPSLGEYKDAIVVPEAAVMEDEKRTTVFLVNGKNEVERVAVKALDSYRGLRVIESGVSEGQKVIVAGIQLVRPGLEVKPESVSTDHFLRESQGRTALPMRSEKLESPIARPIHGNGGAENEQAKEQVKQQVKDQENQQGNDQEK